MNKDLLDRIKNIRSELIHLELAYNFDIGISAIKLLDDLVAEIDRMEGLIRHYKTTISEAIPRITKKDFARLEAIKKEIESIMGKYE